MIKEDFVNLNFNSLLLTTFLLLIFGANLIGQSESKTQNISFNPSAAVSNPNNTTEITRSRLIIANTSVQAEIDRKKTIEDDKTSASQPKTIIVSSNTLISKLELQAFDIINQKRKENGLPPIEWSEDMAKIARLHSQNMARLNFFSHMGKDGLMVNDRADAIGISDWKAIGENIAYNRGYDNPAEFACQRWMLSSTHRENILNRRWKQAGIGVAVNAEGTYYFTQVFVVR